MTPVTPEPPSASQQPLFTWVVKTQVDNGGVFTTFEDEQGLVHWASLSALLARGGRRALVLLALAAHSRPDPQVPGRRVVQASLEDMAAWAGGGDNGWALTTVRPLVRQMEADGLLVRVLGRSLGRGKGTEKTTWILADGLFTNAESPDAGPVGASGDRAVNDRRVIGAPDPGYSMQNPVGVTGGVSPGQVTSQVSRALTSSGPHVDDAMSSPSLMSGPRPDLAVLAPGLTVPALTAALTANLRELNWYPQSIPGAIRSHGLLRTAAWVVHSRAVGLGGGGIREALRAAPDHWPDGWLPGTVLDVRDGLVVARADSQATGGISAGVAGTVSIAVPTLTALQERLDELPEPDRSEVLSLASDIARQGQDPGARMTALEWRSALHAALNSLDDDTEPV